MRTLWLLLAFAALLGVATALPQVDPYKWHKEPPLMKKNTIKTKNAKKVNPLLTRRAHNTEGQRQTPVSAGKPSAPRPAQGFTCGVENNANSSAKVIGGQQASPYQFPWVAFVECVSTGTYCSGSIIARDFVMTAGHCVEGCSTFKIQVGVYDWADSFEEDKLTITSHSSCLHEQYDGDLVLNDIGLVHLPEMLDFDQSEGRIGAVCLPTANDVGNTYANEFGTIAGWGWIDDNPPTPTTLVYYERGMPILENADCALYYGDIIQDGHLCLDTHGQHGTCFGDSGGPLMYYDENNIATVIGVDSFVSSLGCSSEIPDGLTRVTYYLDWINGKMTNGCNDAAA